MPTLPAPGDPAYATRAKVPGSGTSLAGWLLNRPTATLSLRVEQLRRVRGVSDRAASRAQLAKLLEVSEADNITVRVIPFDLDGFASASSAMVYAGGLVPKLDTVVRDVPHGSAFIDSEAQLSAFRTRFRKVEAVSLDPERSRDFIHRLAKEL
jgi:hypothetical protein